jgi:hypothetical protein
MHFGQRCGSGRSALRWTFGRRPSCGGVSFALPSFAPHIPHITGAGFDILKCVTVRPPGVTMRIFFIALVLKCLCISST